MERIKNWPRWIRFGLLAATVELAQIIVGWLVYPSTEIITLASLSPIIVLKLFVLLLLLGVPDYVVQDLLFLTPLIMFIWFLFGCLLGRFVPNTRIALVIWLGVKILLLAGTFSNIIYA